MPLCKYGCGEEITWIDGKAFSLQNHMKVCNKGNAGKKKSGPTTEEVQAAAKDKEVSAATLVGLIKWFGEKRARALLPRLKGDTAVERIKHAIRLESGEA